MKTSSQKSVPLTVTFFNFLGKSIIDLVNNLGAVAVFFSKSLVMIFRPKQLPEIIEQVYHIGARSSAIVMLVGLFTGMVVALQLYYVFAKLGSEGLLGSVVAVALVRELGPVLAAIMITARSGSSMAAEIATLRISEQVDALYTMGIDPIGYLISPRIAASIISFPVLTAFFDLIGILGGYFAGVVLLGADPGTYFSRVQSSLEFVDVRDGFIKTFVFAVIVSTICCFQGYFTHMRSESHGAKAVGSSTTSAVVLSCVMILIADYVVVSFLM
jgi:phospholipid/cholesterol/gamma-HCH transport system permease protein